MEFGLRTLQGQTAYSFALAAGHHNICTILSEEANERNIPQVITKQTAIPIESTLCTADLTGQGQNNNPLEAILAGDENVVTEINALRKTIETLSVRLNSSDKTIASLERTVNKQTAQINELYMLINNMLHQKNTIPFIVKPPSPAEEAESTLVSIPIHPDYNTQKLNPDPSIFDLSPNCLHSAEFTTVPEDVEEDRLNSSSSPAKEPASSDTSLDVICLPCEHVCHYASLAHLEAVKECVICEMPIDDYIEVNTK